MKVSVPKSLGPEITVTTANGTRSKTYKVTDGSVTVPDNEAPTFLWAVAGSQASDGEVTAAEAPEVAAPPAGKTSETAPSA